MQISILHLECFQSYGENCQFSCSINCINETCERINGSCIYGCKNGMDCSKGTFFICLFFKIYFVFCIYIHNNNKPLLLRKIVFDMQLFKHSKIPTIILKNVFFLDATNYLNSSPYISGSLFETVGGIVGAVVSLIVGGAMTMFVIR